MGAEPDLTDATARVLEIVRAVVVDLSDGRGVGRIGLDTSFERELGLGSLERVELAVRVERDLGVRLPEAAFGTVDSVRQLLELLGAPARGSSPSVASTAADRAALLSREPPVAPPMEARTLVELLEYHLRLQPDRVHIVLEDEDGTATAVTHRALHAAATAMASALRARGLERGRTVAIMLPTGLPYFATFMGTLMAGGVPVPLYPPMRLDRIAEYVARCAGILDNAQAQILVTFDRAARVAQIARDRVASIEHVLAVESLAREAAPSPVGAAQAELGPDDTALIQYTSGSTGDPKGVELTHANVLANIRAAAAGCALVGSDVLVSWLPLYHDMGLIAGWLMPLFGGVPTVVMSPLSFLSRPRRWLAALSDYRATCSVAPNFAFDLCVKRIEPSELVGLDLHRVRAILNGSEPILPATLDRFVGRFEAVGLRRDTIFCAYGLAENMVAVTFPPVSRPPRIDRIDRARFEAEGMAVPSEAADALSFVGVGRAVPGHEIQVVDANEVPLPERRRGVVRFRGPSTFKGYYRRPDATAAVKREGGWVDTGDLGYIAEGELFIVGRAKDIIIKGGRNYYPHEIEEAAAMVAGIRQGCVVAFAQRDDEAGTEQIVVVAETRERDAVSRESLVGRVVESITTRVGVPPDRVVLVAPGVVPKTSSGKVQRARTRALWLEGALEQRHGSFARQAAGLYLRGLPSRIGGWLRGGLALAYGLWAALAIGSVCLMALLLGRIWPAGAPARRLASFEATLALTLAGLRPRRIDTASLPEGASLLVANHCSYLDFIVAAATLPSDVHILVKGELRDTPLVGVVLRRLGHLFVDRHSTARSLADLEQVVALLREGRRVLVFPEGTFSAEIGLRPFKLGAFRLACEHDVPVVPCAMRGTRKALRDGTWLPKRSALVVEVLPALQPTGREVADVVALRDAAAAAIAEHVDEPRLFAADIAVPGAG
ncbi:MAG: AMP-binding protein [Deltaproteobacteria bacterium]|nr:AMP-binding protein [Deltaproteobacteria bacterium]MBK8715232.1 AMP-binding protein [Deltaproteobacteria bacterium]MBP7285062.1 AMP-binding protein [Nannocystaceae bacterium]